MKKQLMTFIAVSLGLCLWGAEVAEPAGVGGDPLAWTDAAKLADPTPRPFYYELVASLLAKQEKM